VLINPTTIVAISSFTLATFKVMTTIERIPGVKLFLSLLILSVDATGQRRIRKANAMKVRSLT
jgi:hypothetical protein